MRQSEDFVKAIAFAWAIAFARWPIFKIVSFLQYLVFFRAVFSEEQLQCSCRMVFRTFLAFFIFDPNSAFCKGYSICMGSSLCKMADFQNRLISPIFGVFFFYLGFFERFSPHNNSNVLVELFLACFWHF